MSYSFAFPKVREEQELFAQARAEDVEASYKDLAQVCARIRGKPVSWALRFLERAAHGEIPVLYSRYNKRLGHRGELQGRKGRYPQKAARIVLKVLQSATANGGVHGLVEPFRVAHASANQKHSYPRMSSKGRRSRQAYATARVEVIVQATERKLEEKKTPDKKAEKKEGPGVREAPVHIGKPNMQAVDEKPKTQNKTSDSQPTTPNPKAHDALSTTQNSKP